MPTPDPLAGQIIGCCYRVANGLGYGFLEKCYENALAFELRKAKLRATGLTTCLLVNFGKAKIEVRRLSMTRVKGAAAPELEVQDSL